MTLVLPFLASPAPCCCCCKARVNSPRKHVYIHYFALHNLSWPDSPLVRQPACSFSASGINMHPIGSHHVTTTAPPRCCRPLDTDSSPAEEIPSPTASTLLTSEISRALYFVFAGNGYS
ncbi:hypothetical protein COCVIDRAFT_39994 [Bipolaris victoriae FI3]|uniref:C2H2-type domain-containing protein n=2 Tax=Bipolaris TaxID=33194 RepID=W6Y8S2_COCC2|nr:uncharacterized protein COCCADRAFT_36348 [Bipolaris zeicola 26-R-13]XP_014554096.1 hypothetical protein COCVIDRAFT_39994 [Bipolaris victoriae FI3]EUC33895.1 hypothetical protein COCCADRAFT_36348 [Bipolaris zeicola 26-R-13]